VYLDPTAVVISPETGILYSQVECDQEVPQGAVLGHITDFFGKTLAEVRSPLDGLVLYIVSTPPIVKGQPVACVGVPHAAPRVIRQP
jgi:predicted deacylase